MCSSCMPRRRPICHEITSLASQIELFKHMPGLQTLVCMYRGGKSMLCCAWPMHKDKILHRSRSEHHKLHDKRSGAAVVRSGLLRGASVCECKVRTYQALCCMPLQHGIAGLDSFFCPCCVHSKCVLSCYGSFKGTSQATPFSCLIRRNFASDKHVVCLIGELLNRRADV